MLSYTHSHQTDQKQSTATPRLPASKASRDKHRSYSQVPMVSKTAVALQAKMTVSKPGDRFEQEADRVSQQVMQMSAPQVQRSCSCGGGCPTCQAKHQQSHTSSNSSAATQSAPGIVGEALRSASQPMDNASKAFFEPRFGQDFSTIRIHSGATAAHAARSIGAEAFTVGNNIVLGDHRSSSRELMAHELTHTIQQGATAPLAGAGQEQAISPSGEASNTIQRRTLGLAGSCWFEHCESQLENFFMIHEDGLAGFHPSGGSSFRVDNIDGLWFKHHTPKSEWFKVPDIGTGQVTCNDNERAPTITSPVLPFATAFWTSDRIHTANPY